MKLPDCMMPDGAEPCIGYRELQAEVEKLRSQDEVHWKTRRSLLADNQRFREAIWAIGEYAKAEFREGEKGYQAALLAAKVLADE